MIYSQKSIGEIYYNILGLKHSARRELEFYLNLEWKNPWHWTFFMLREEMILDLRGRLDNIEGLLGEVIRHKHKFKQYE